MMTGQFFRDWVQKIRRRINKDFLTYLFFLLIAVIIWYMNALSRDYTADFEFTVRYTALPDDRVMAGTPPEHVFLTLNAQGFTLLKYRLGLIFNAVTLETGYPNIRRNSGAPPDEYFILTQTAFDRIAAQLGQDVQLRHIAPDTLKLFLSKTIEKKLPVSSALRMQYIKGFLPKGKIQIEPAEVTVTGPKIIIDTMQHVYTRTKLYKRLSDTLRVTIDLQPQPQLRYSVPEVMLMQPIERHTEASVSVPIDPVNAPGAMTMKCFPKNITVSCLVPVGEYENLKPAMFRAVADYNDIRAATGSPEKVRVNIVRAPDWAVDIQCSPRNVDFIIEN